MLLVLEFFYQAVVVMEYTGLSKNAFFYLVYGRAIDFGVKAAFIVAGVNAPTFTATRTIFAVRLENILCFSAGLVSVSRLNKDVVRYGVVINEIAA